MKRHGGTKSAVARVSEPAGPRVFAHPADLEIGDTAE